MKKLFIAAFIGLTVISSSFAMGANEVNLKAINSFKHDFKGVSNVKWTVKSGMHTAAFIADGVQTEVFYDSDGSQIATCKAAQFSDLPGNTRKLFTEKYAGYTITELISYEDTENFHYFMSVENDRQKLILKVTNGRISVF